LCSKKNLTEAEQLYDSSVKLKSGKIGARALSEQSQLIADASYILSLVAQAEEQASKALFYARLSVKNCNQAWNILERSRTKLGRIARRDTPKTEKDHLPELMSELSISEHQPAEDTATRCSSLQTAAFWELVPRLFRGLIHLTSILAHHGLIPEVLYYLGRAKKIAEAVHAPCLIGQCLALMGQFRNRQGEVVKGALLLQQAEKVLPGMPHDQRFAAVQSVLAVHFAKGREPQAGETAFATAEKVLQQLTTKSFLESLSHKRPKTESLTMQMEMLILGGTKPARQAGTNRGRAVTKKSVSKPAAQPIPSQHTDEEIPAIEAILLNRMKGEFLRARILALIREERVDRAANLLEDAAAYPSDQQGVVLQALLTARVRLHQGLDQLISDPVFCVIHESTISCPSIRTLGETHPKIISQDPKTRNKTTASSKQIIKIPAKKTRPRSPSIAKAEADFLRLAHSGMKEVLGLARRTSPTTILHEVSDVLGRILVVLSATSSSAAKNSVSATLLAYVLGTLPSL